MASGDRAMAVRPATRADALAIATVHVHAWKVAYRGLLPQAHLDGLDPRRSVEEWEAVLDATSWPSTGVLVLTEPSHPSSSAGTTDADGRTDADADSIIGLAGVSPTRDDDQDPSVVGELQTLYLDPDVWRRGGGSILLDSVRRQLRQARFSWATAWVLETNAGARQFYERHGWRHDGASKPHDWGTFVVTDVRYRVSLT